MEIKESLEEMDEVIRVTHTHPHGVEVICENEAAGPAPNPVQVWNDHQDGDYEVRITGQFAGCDLVTVTL